MSATATQQAQTVTTQRWVADPSRSRVEFAVRHFWGLHTVEGHFDRFEGSYLVGPAGSAIELTVDAASLDTGNALRDRHLRSDEYFNVEEHPQVRFRSQRVSELGDGRVHVSGDLDAAGTRVPVALDASVRELDGELEIEGTTVVDQHAFGMGRGPLWNVRPPTRLHVKARLVRARPE